MCPAASATSRRSQNPSRRHQPAGVTGRSNTLPGPPLGFVVSP
jgi:hypothetical protein